MKRRTFIKSSTLTAFSVATLGTIHWDGNAFTGDTPTTTDILGPYYRPGAPMRNNLIPPDAKGDILHLNGTIFQSDSRTPLSDVLVEAWQCDPHQHYDNASDDFLFRGATKTGVDGKYYFKTMVPVPYKNENGNTWRPAHIHLRVSSSKAQDLVTQIYFKNDPYLDKDSISSAPQAKSRILEMTDNSAKEKVIQFDIVMSKTYPLNDEGYSKVCGVYRLKNDQGNVEFYREDDLLFLKLNGWIREALVYKGDNTFEGAVRSYWTAKFEILQTGGTKVIIYKGNFEDLTQIQTYEGVKFLKYKN